MNRNLDDGLGVRRLETDPHDGGAVEVLEVTPALAAAEGFEDAVRARAARLAEVGIEGLVPVRRVEKRGDALCVISDHVEGLRLPELLHEAIKGNTPLSQPAALDLAGRILRIVSQLHSLPGVSHGAITPAHVVVTRTAAVYLTDPVFAPALEGLQRNREQLWREFGVALPASASLPRFDQRADVAQLGATVLAIALGRTLRLNEYPRAINEVVMAATLAARPGETGTSASALRMWLQETLFLHPRATLGSAIDAEKAFSEALGPLSARRGGAAAFEHTVARIFGDASASVAEAVQVAAAWAAAQSDRAVASAAPAREPEPEAPPADTPRRPLSSIFRAVLPNFRLG